MFMSLLEHCFHDPGITVMDFTLLKSSRYGGISTSVWCHMSFYFLRQHQHLQYLNTFCSASQQHQFSATLQHTEPPGATYQHSVHYRISASPTPLSLLHRQTISRNTLPIVLNTHAPSYTVWNRPILANDRELFSALRLHLVTS